MEDYEFKPGLLFNTGIGQLNCGMSAESFSSKQKEINSISDLLLFINNESIVHPGSSF